MSTRLKFVSFQAGVTDYRVRLFRAGLPPLGLSPVATSLPEISDAFAYQIVLSETLPPGEYAVHYYRGELFLNTAPLIILADQEAHWIGLDPTRNDPLLSETELAQLRYRLGLDGPAEAPEATPRLPVTLSTAALAQLAGMTIIVNTPALIGNQLNTPIIRGDTYSSSIGNSLDLANPNWPELPPGTTIELQARQKRLKEGFDLTGSIVPETDQNVIRFEMTSAETNALKAGIYQFGIVATVPDSQPFHLLGPEATLRVLNGL